MLARYLSASVPSPVRAKGLRYHRTGAVVAISGSEWAAHAIVRGGRNYRVEIARDREGFRASCDCPYFTDHAQVCKHIWAAVLEADERVRLRVGQRLEQHGVDDAEDRGVRADAEREREHGRERERGPAHQPPKRMAQIASHWRFT